MQNNKVGGGLLWKKGEVVLSDVGVPEATVLAYLKVKSKVCLSFLLVKGSLAVPEKLPSLQASYNWHIHHLNDSRHFTARESKQENDTKQAIILKKWSPTA